MERLYNVNPTGLDEYMCRRDRFFNKGLLQPRTRTLFLDSFYVFARLGLGACVMINLLRKNYNPMTFLKIFGVFYAADKSLPWAHYNLLEANRMIRLKREARKYYEFEEENLDRVWMVLDPSTPVSKLRNFSL